MHLERLAGKKSVPKNRKSDRRVERFAADQQRCEPGQHALHPQGNSPLERSKNPDAPFVILDFKVVCRALPYEFPYVHGVILLSSWSPIPQHGLFWPCFHPDYLVVRLAYPAPR